MSRKIVNAVCLATLLASAPGAARAEQWKTYTNDRFGQRADYPAGWKMQPAPENNDGRRFVSPDGTASITISGMLALESRAEEMAEAAKPPAGQTVVYSKRGDDWIVLSGTQGDRIIYSKRILSCRDQIWNDVTIEYPKAEKAKYDALVAHVAASLKAGPGYQVAKCK